MPEPRMTFSAVRQLLTSLGFREVPVKKPFIGLSMKVIPMRGSCSPPTGVTHAWRPIISPRCASSWTAGA